MKQLKKVGFVIFLSLIFIVVFLLTKPNFTGNIPTQDPDPEVDVYSCNDGICSKPYEDGITCPEDCEKSFKISPLAIILLTILIILMLFYINFYRGKADIRKIQKSPFKSESDLNSVVNYIDHAMTIKVQKNTIAKNLLKAGWSKKQILYAYEECKWRKKKVLLETTPKKQVSLAPVEDYMQRCLNAGATIAEVNKRLLKVGWTKDQLKKAFKNIKKKV